MVPLALVHHQRVICVMCFRNFSSLCVQGDMLFMHRLWFVLRVLPRRLRLNFMLCFLEPFSDPYLLAGLTQSQGGWRWSHKLLRNGGSSSGLLVGVASDAAPPHCTPGLAVGGAFPQCFVSAEVEGAQGIVCLSLGSDLQLFPSDTWVIHRTVF